jgi:hypothetical protein
MSRSIPGSEAHVLVHQYHRLHLIVDLLMILVIAGATEILKVLLVSYLVKLSSAHEHDVHVVNHS